MPHYSTKKKERVEYRYYLENIYKESRYYTEWIYTREDGTQFRNLKRKIPVVRGLLGQVFVERRAFLAR